MSRMFRRSGALRIFASDKPTLRFGPIQPMSQEDADFWRRRRERELERQMEATRA